MEFGVRHLSLYCDTYSIRIYTNFKGAKGTIAKPKKNRRLSFSGGEGFQLSSFPNLHIQYSGATLWVSLAKSWTKTDKTLALMGTDSEDPDSIPLVLENHANSKTT